jgi:hypothetical protein
MGNKSDYNRIIDTFLEIGAERLGTADVQMENDDYNPCQAEFWHVIPPKNKGIILLNYLDGTCALYELVGEDGDEVEKDIAFLKNLVEPEKNVRESTVHTSPNQVS